MLVAFLRQVQEADCKKYVFQAVTLGQKLREIVEQFDKLPEEERANFIESVVDRF